MKSTILKFGGYGLLIGIVVFGLALTFGDELSYTAQEIIGYGAMIVSLSFVFFGIKHYRDNVNNGQLRFGKGLVIGLLISCLVGLGIGFMDYLYTTVINPDFADEYLERTLKLYESQFSGEELKAKSEELTQQMKDYGGSWFMAFLMFMTVALIGTVMSIISSLILQRKH